MTKFVYLELRAIKGYYMNCGTHYVIYAIKKGDTIWCKSSPIKALVQDCGM